MSNRGYDVVVDVDDEGDLGHTDLQEDLEFHNSNFDDPNTARTSKIPSDTPAAISANPFLSSRSSSQPKRIFLSLSYYTQFFDVDTSTVLLRCRAALFPRANFLDLVDGNPDLYGPFWIATTVIGILFLSGTISWKLTRGQGKEGDGKQWGAYDWGLLSGAAGLVYGYTAVIPTLLFLTLHYLSIASTTLLELLTLYGYSNLIWIPVALISWSPLSLLNWIFVGIGFGISVVFLLRNLWPVLGATDVKTSKVLLIVVAVLHAALAIAIKVLFFKSGSWAAKDDKKEEAPKEGSRF